MIRRNSAAAVASRIIHLLQDYCHSPTHLRQIQAQLILHNLHQNTTLAAHFISACRSLSCLPAAFRLYTTVTSSYQQPAHRFIFNQLIRAFSVHYHHHHHYYSVSVYYFMHSNSVPFNNYTFPFVLKSLSHLRKFREGQCVQAHVVKLGHFNDIYVGNSLLNLYASCGDMQMCRYLFDEMSHRDVVSWTVIVDGYKEAGKFGDALVAFERMLSAGVEPNRATVVTALAACANSGALDMGMWIHEFVKERHWKLDVKFGTALVDMYGKCGRVGEGLEVFLLMEEKNVFTWNALIKGFALAKSGTEAMFWFSKMEEEGFKADEVTLLAVLGACVHSGLVESGREIFASLRNLKYGFAPNVKHYACTVDLLSRKGYLEEALKIINEMPCDATKTVWGAFLSGCRAHGNQELSEFAARKLVELEPDNSAYYVMLSNVCADMRRWDEVERVRGMMKERELNKGLGGSSCVEVEYHHDHQYVFKWLADTTTPES